LSKINKQWHTNIKARTISDFFNIVEKKNDEKCVLIIDEVEGINHKYFGKFLHSIRRTYHTRLEHCLKNVILVGVSNIVGIVQDNASPFNIADNLNIPYFTKDEVFELWDNTKGETGPFVLTRSFIPDILDHHLVQPGSVIGFAVETSINWISCPGREKRIGFVFTTLD